MPLTYSKLNETTNAIMTETTQEEASLGDCSGNSRCADQANNFFHNEVVDPSLGILHISLPQISHKTQRMLRSFLQMDSSSSIVAFSMVGIDASLPDPLGKF